MAEETSKRPSIRHPEPVDFRPTPPAEHRTAVMEERRRNAKAMAKMAIEFQTLHEKAYTDELTGLGNRRFFNEQFPLLFEYARKHNLPIALVYADVRGLKRTNDSKELGGHDKGDQLLISAAQSIKGIVRENDIVARLGGDEFVAILLGYEPRESETLAELNEATLSRLATNFQTQAHEHGIPEELHVGLDAALVTVVGDELPQDMLARADRATTALKVQNYADLAARGVSFVDSRLQA